MPRKLDPNKVYPYDKNKYYVYALCKPNGVPFYIGKGKGVRINEHFLPSCMKVNSPKVGVIKKYGNSVKREILCYFDLEESAYEFEESLIAYYGLLSEGGLLTNYAKTRYEYSKAFVEDVCSKSNLNKEPFYPDELIFKCFDLYFKQCMTQKQISKETGVHLNYLGYLVRGCKRKNLITKYREENPLPTPQIRTL